MSRNVTCDSVACFEIVVVVSGGGGFKKKIFFGLMIAYIALFSALLSRLTALAYGST